MKISISSVKFDNLFMFSDPEDIKNELRKMLSGEWKASTTFAEKHGTANLDFILVLDRKTLALEVKGPTADEELVDFALWLPFKEIKRSNNYRMTYIEYVREGMLHVLDQYDFDLAPFEKIFSTLKEQELSRKEQ